MGDLPLSPKMGEPDYLSGESPRPKPPAHGTVLSRAGTMSWHQRLVAKETVQNEDGKQTRDRNVYSGLTGDVDSVHQPADTDSGRAPTAPNSRPLSRQFQGSDFLRETAERASRSEAYRQSQESGKATTSTSRGLTGPSSPEKHFMSPSEESFSLNQSANGSPTKASEARTPARTPLASPNAKSLPLGQAQRLSSQVSDENLPVRNNDQPFRPMAMSPTQARMSMGLEPRAHPRPPSPTKGLGGFVQSAMMKRTDSLTRRDSARGKRPLSVGGSLAAPKEEKTVEEDAPQKPSSTSPVKASFLRSEAQPELSPKPSFDGASQSPTQEEPSRPGSSKLELSTKDGPQTQDKPKPRPAPLDTKPQPDAKHSAAPRSSPSPIVENSPFSKFQPTLAQRPSWMEELSKKKAARESADVAKVGVSSESPANRSSAASGLGSVKPADAGRAASPFDAKSQHAQRPSVGKGFPGAGSPSPRTYQFKPSDSSSGSPMSRPTSKGIAGIKRESVTETPQPGHEKPTPPPKIDFRGNLKRNQTPSEKSRAEEAEFKSVFGKLKKTETKNYVAPDELKGNILRGKADLTLTGGPKKTEKRDEFKESILKKKEEMKAGGGSIHRQPGSASGPSTSTKASASNVAESAKPATGFNSIGEDSAKPDQQVAASTFGKVGTLPSLTKSKSNDAPKVDLITPDNGDKKSPAKSPTKSFTAPATSPVPRTESKGSVAERFNPNLASLIGRRPSPTSDPAAPSTSPEKSAMKCGARDSGNAEKGEALTHATKSRARGPKRRLPTAASAPGKSTPFEDADDKKSTPCFGSNGHSIEIAPSNPSPTKSSPAKPVPTAALVGMEAAKKAETLTKPPATSSKPSSAKAWLPKTKEVLTASDAASATSDASVKPAIEGHGSPKAGSDPKPVVSPKPEIATKPKPQATKAASLASQRSPPMSPKSPNIVLPTKGAAPSSQASENGTSRLGITSPKAIPRSISATLEVSPGSPKSEAQKSPRSPRIPPKDLDKPARSPRSPPVPAKDSEKLSRITFKSSLASKDVPVAPKAAELSREAKLIVQCFKDIHSVPFNTDVGTQAILAKPAAPLGKIRTLHKEVYELTGDGKRMPVPAGQEHFLFENHMYLCTHVYATDAGKKTIEVYLWCGDGVASSAVEDAQLFGRNAAKDAGGKLVLLSQGKEPAAFFEALGGIVVIRQGSAAAASATYMLRGRRHVSQIAFDEVLLTPRALCSGFPHIVVANDGTLFLWKGRGSNADELGCARLIGMDLGRAGELVEVDEGAEPPAFWAAFGKGAGAEPPAPPAEHWVRKASNDKYRTRLFAVDARPKSTSGFGLWNRLPGTPPADGGAAGIRELSPYSQADLSRDGVFVLDTYFEIFVYVPLQFTLVHSMLTHVRSGSSVLPRPPNTRPFAPRSSSRRSMASWPRLSKIGLSCPLAPS